jgi:2-phospho-L-lactate guanylyltransferase
MKGGKRLWAVVPAKNFRQAKTRLAPLLDAEQRAELAGLMLADVLAGLRELDELAGILVVTRDSRAKDIAGAYGARAVDDPVEDGPNAAIRRALPVLRACSGSGMIVVPSDVPGIEAEQIRPILQALHEPCVALVTAARDRGTNLLGCAPIDLIAPHFGPDSFARHVEAARIAGMEPQIFTPASIAHDIDRPEDLRAFAARRITKTGAFIAEVLVRGEKAGLCDELVATP